MSWRTHADIVTKRLAGPEGDGGVMARAKAVRAFLDQTQPALETLDAEDRGDQPRWVAWVREYAYRLDPVKSPRLVAKGARTATPPLIRHKDAFRCHRCQVARVSSPKVRGHGCFVRTRMLSL